MSSRNSATWSSAPRLRVRGWGGLGSKVSCLPLQCVLVSSRGSARFEALESPFLVSGVSVGPCWKSSAAAGGGSPMPVRSRNSNTNSAGAGPLVGGGGGGPDHLPPGPPAAHLHPAAVAAAAAAAAAHQHPHHHMNPLPGHHHPHPAMCPMMPGMPHVHNDPFYCSPFGSPYYRWGGSLAFLPPPVTWVARLVLLLHFMASCRLSRFLESAYVRWGRNSNDGHLWTNYKARFNYYKHQYLPQTNRNGLYYEITFRHKLIIPVTFEKISTKKKKACDIFT